MTVSVFAKALSASQAKEAQEKFNQAIKTWKPLFKGTEWKELSKTGLNFQLEVNGIGTLRFVKHQTPEQIKSHSQLIASLNAEVDSLRAEVAILEQTLQPRDQEIKLKRREIYGKEFYINQLQAERRTTPYKIENFGNIGTKEFDRKIEKLFSIIFEAGRKPTLYSVLYRLWTALCINGDIKQGDISLVPEELRVTWGEEYVQRQSNSQKLKEDLLEDNDEPDYYFSQMEEAEEY